MARQPRAITGKVVLVTGGARGIGLATARALAAEGARVAIGDLDEDLAKRGAKDLGGDAIGLFLDVTDFAGFDAVLDEVERQLGPLDVLINNAGIMPLALVDDESDDSMTKQLQINLAAVIHGTRAAIRRMKPRRRGHIVNIASVAGKVGTAGAATYSATKHGVVGLCEAAHFELHGSGVDISCVMPTIVRTELAAGLGQTRLSSQIAPEQVAAAIVDVLRRPRLEVWVPRYLGTLSRFVRVLPRPLAEWILRVGGTDRLLAAAVHASERDEYERRAAASARGANEG